MSLIEKHWQGSRYRGGGVFGKFMMLENSKGGQYGWRGVSEEKVLGEKEGRSPIT